MLPEPCFLFRTLCSLKYIYSFLKNIPSSIMPSTEENLFLKKPRRKRRALRDPIRSQSMLRFSGVYTCISGVGVSYHESHSSHGPLSFFWEAEDQHWCFPSHKIENPNYCRLLQYKLHSECLYVCVSV